MFSHAPVALVKCGTMISVKLFASKYFLAPRSKAASIRANACISGVENSLHLCSVVFSFSRCSLERSRLERFSFWAKIGFCKAQAKLIAWFCL